MLNEKVLNFESAQSLVDRAGALHDEISAKDKELKELKLRLAELADYKEGSKTGHVFCDKFHATVALKENVKWDQKALEALRIKMGDANFFKVFRWIFEPQSKKVLDGAIDFGEFGSEIKKAFTTSPGSPQVTFKPMEDN